MLALTKTADLATRKLPKFISPESHRTIDYLIAGGFALAGAVYWRRDRRTAVASLACGVSMVALTMATRFNGSRAKPISLRDHRRVETGMAAAFALLPEFLGLKNRGKEHFIVQAAVLTAVGNLTCVADRDCSPSYR